MKTKLFQQDKLTLNFVMESRLILFFRNLLKQQKEENRRVVSMVTRLATRQNLRLATTELRNLPLHQPLKKLHLIEPLTSD